MSFWAPEFKPNRNGLPFSFFLDLTSLGFWITMGAQLIAIGLVGVMAIFNYRYNRKLDRGELPPIGGVASFRYAL